MPYGATPMVTAFSRSAGVDVDVGGAAHAMSAAASGNHVSTRRR
jgi:hypothetical protein